MTRQQNETSATHGKNHGEKWLSKLPQNNTPKLSDFKETISEIAILRQ